MSSWRDDPNWVLVQWNRDYWTSPPKAPTAIAELCGEGEWASVFKDNRPVATWLRTQGVGKKRVAVKA